MTNLESYQLVHPELLSEDTLLQVLKDRCIKVPKSKSFDKAKLVEMFKRIALPLPQRTYNDKTHLGRKLNNLRKSRGQEAVASAKDVVPTTSTTTSDELSPKNNGHNPVQVGLIGDRLKMPLVGTGIVSKKIRLSKSPMTSDTTCGTDKRKNKETLEEETGRQKRQKITWP